jgi:hypothetical protein
VKNKKTIGLLGIALAAITAMYAVKNRKVIKNKALDVGEEAKEKSAIAFHRRIGMPVYNYLKKKHDLPF